MIVIIAPKLQEPLMALSKTAGRQLERLVQRLLLDG
jgi:hypothetical protein